MSERLSKINKLVRGIPHEPGVYMMRDRFGNVIYVGKAKDLRKRVGSYFQASKKAVFLEVQPKIAALVSLVHDLEYITVKSEAEALILESKLIKQWKPRYNTVSKDDRKFLMVKVDMASELPQFRLTRNRTGEKSLYFGPFTNTRALRKTLHELREKYGILLGDARPVKLEGGKYRLYDDVRGEIYGHENELTADEYKERVMRACAVLEGKAFEWFKEVEVQMAAAAEKRDYEKAAGLRDLLTALKETQSPRRQFKKYLEPSAGKEGGPSKQLEEVLGLKQPLRRMECFDISHVSGEFVVASMVHFFEGKPDKKQYRRYKIRSFVGNDDYRAMEEVVGRRYRRLKEEGREFPDLIVIDGGKGQVNAALKAFLLLGLEAPALIGLAKKKETIVFPDERGEMNLPLHSEALRLLQRLRDEAHRFANAFNADLRSKKIKESVLDDFPGIGPVRKEILLEHFKSLSKMKKAGVKELQEVPGVGAKLAQELYEYLKQLG